MSEVWEMTNLDSPVILGKIPPVHEYGICKYCRKGFLWQEQIPRIRYTGRHIATGKFTKNGTPITYEEYFYDDYKVNCSNVMCTRLQ